MIGLIGMSCRVIAMYGVNGNSLNGIESLYAKSKACVSVFRPESDWFKVKWISVKSVMCLWLFNVFMDGMIEVRKKLKINGSSLWDAMCEQDWKVD